MSFFRLADHTGAVRDNSLTSQLQSSRLWQTLRVYFLMLSLMRTEPPERDYNLDELVIDSLLGMCPLVVAAGFGLVIAGLEFAAFVLPMLVFMPFAYFEMGMWRGKSLGNLWLKALCLSGVAILLASALGNTQSVLAVALLTIPFTASGIWLRRRTIRKTARHGL